MGLALYKSCAGGGAMRYSQSSACASPAWPLTGLRPSFRFACKTCWYIQGFVTSGVLTLFWYPYTRTIARRASAVFPGQNRHISNRTMPARACAWLALAGLMPSYLVPYGLSHAPNALPLALPCPHCMALAWPCPWPSNYFSSPCFLWLQSVRKGSKKMGRAESGGMVPWHCPASI